LLLGDLLQLLRVLFEPTLAATPGSATWDPGAHFDASFGFEWRIAVLNRLACARYGLPATASLPEEDLRARQLRAAMYGHGGRYHGSIRENEKILESVRLDDASRARYMLAVANGWFIYSAHLRGSRLLQRAEQWIEAKPGLATYRIQVHQLKMMMSMRMAQARATGCRGGPHRDGCSVTFRRNVVLFRGEPRLAGAAGCLGRATDSYSIMQSELASRVDHLPFLAREGYQSLGLVSLDAIAAVRDQLRTPPYRLGAEREDAGVRAIRQAHFYGWQHEL
jgi:hypothetical protein